MKRRVDKKGKILYKCEFEREDGRYEYRYTDELTKERRSIYAYSLEELREKKDRLTIERYSGIDISSKQITIDDVYEIWKKNKVDIARSTFENYCYMYERFVYGKFGKNKICNLVKSDIKSFYKKLIDDKKMTVPTLDSVHTVLHQVLQLAEDDRYIGYNPADKALEPIKRKYTKLRKLADKANKVKKSLSPQEEIWLFDYLKNAKDVNIDVKRWYRVFRFIDRTGMRGCEFSAIQKHSIDYENKYVNVEIDLVPCHKYDQENRNKRFKTTYYIGPTKTPAGTRTIPLTDELIELVKEEQEWQKEAGIVCNKKVYTEDNRCYDNFLFLTSNGSHYSISTLNKALKTIINNHNDYKKRIGKDDEQLPIISVHKLRHTFNSRLAETGVTMEVRMAILGHSSPDVNVEIYTHIDDTVIKDVMKQFENYDKCKKNVSQVNKA